VIPPGDPAPDEEPPVEAHKRSLLDRTFTISIILKGLDGVIEMIGGLLLLVVSPDSWHNLAIDVTRHELSQDPNDYIANHLLHASGDLNQTRVFGALYLLTHGAVKMGARDRVVEAAVVGLPGHDRLLARLHRLPALPNRGGANPRHDRPHHLRHVRHLARVARVPAPPSIGAPTGRLIATGANENVALTSPINVADGRAPPAATKRLGTGRLTSTSPETAVARCPTF